MYLLVKSLNLTVTFTVLNNDGFYRLKFRTETVSVLKTHLTNRREIEKQLNFDKKRGNE